MLEVEEEELVAVPEPDPDPDVPVGLEEPEAPVPVPVGEPLVKVPLLEPEEARAVEKPELAAEAGTLASAEGTPAGVVTRAG